MIIIKTSNRNEFEQILNEKEFVIVDFFAPWCGPCKMLAPIIEKINSELPDNFGVIKINTDEESDLARSFNIRSIPTLIFFRNKEIKHVVTGFVTEKVIYQIIEKIS